MDPTREYFDGVADRWAEMRRTFFGDGARAAAMEAAGIGPGSLP